MTKVYYSNDKGIGNDPFFQQFNLLFKDAFKANSMFQPFGKDYKPPYPLDAWFNDEFYVFEFPIVNGSVENIEILKEGDILRIKYTRPESKDDEKRTYVTKGITQKDFNLAWKIPSSFDKDKISSTFENGLLSIFIPFAETQKPEKVQVIDISNNWKKVAEGTPLTVVD